MNKVTTITEDHPRLKEAQELWVKITENPFGDYNYIDLLHKFENNVRTAEVLWAKDPQSDEWITAEERVNLIKEALVLKFQFMQTLAR